jgi:hypothetical protein
VARGVTRLSAVRAVGGAVNLDSIVGAGMVNDLELVMTDLPNPALGEEGAWARKQRSLNQKQGICSRKQSFWPWKQAWNGQKHHQLALVCQKNTALADASKSSDRFRPNLLSENKELGCFLIGGDPLQFCKQDRAPTGSSFGPKKFRHR